MEHFKYYLYGKPFTVITDHRALLSIMREIRSNKSYNSRLTRWVDRLLPFEFSIDHLPGTKMGLLDYISRDPHQQAANISTYDEQFIVAKLDIIKRSATKRFLLNAKNYVDFAARNQSTNCVATNPNSTNNLCSDFAPRNPEHSTSTQIDDSISELTINNLNSIPKIETTNIPHSLFALNRPTEQSHSNLNHFQRIATKFKNVYMMSQSPSDDETLMTVKQSTPSRSQICRGGAFYCSGGTCDPHYTYYRYNSHFAFSRRFVHGFLQLRALQDLLKLSHGQPDNQGRDLERDSRLHFDGQ